MFFISNLHYIIFNDLLEMLLVSLIIFFCLLNIFSTQSMPFYYPGKFIFSQILSYFIEFEWLAILGARVRVKDQAQWIQKLFFVGLKM